MILEVLVFVGLVVGACIIGGCIDAGLLRVAAALERDDDLRR